MVPGSMGKGMGKPPSLGTRIWSVQKGMGKPPSLGTGIWSVQKGMVKRPSLGTGIWSVSNTTHNFLFFHFIFFPKKIIITKTNSVSLTMH